jgi:hypothetical protein
LYLYYFQILDHDFPLKSPHPKKRVLSKILKNSCIPAHTIRVSLLAEKVFAEGCFLPHLLAAEGGDGLAS